MLSRGPWGRVRLSGPLEFPAGSSVNVPACREYFSLFLRPENFPSPKERRASGFFLPLVGLGVSLQDALPSPSCLARYRPSLLRWKESSSEDGLSETGPRVHAVELGRTGFVVWLLSLLARVFSRCSRCFCSFGRLCGRPFSRTCTCKGTSSCVANAVLSACMG